MHYLKKVILTTDRIDYWICRHVIQFYCETHPAQHKLASRFSTANVRRPGIDRHVVLGRGGPCGHGFQRLPASGFSGG
jgi:hypothetical protein